MSFSNDALALPLRFDFAELSSYSFSYIDSICIYYTPVDPKQFFHIHVVILAPDVGNFESISMGNSMNYKQHVFMYYCYLGGSMLV